MKRKGKENTDLLIRSEGEMVRKNEHHIHPKKNKI